MYLSICLLVFLPLNLESFAYRLLSAFPVHLHRKSNEKIHRIMKIKNIFFAAILVLAGFSCSMEDDAIMNDVETVSYTHLDVYKRQVCYCRMPSKIRLFMGK